MLLVEKLSALSKKLISIETQNEKKCTNKEFNPIAFFRIKMEE